MEGAINCPLRAQAALRGAAPALYFSRRWYTYRELHDYTAARVSEFRSKGVIPGDRVALALPAGIDMIACLMALARLRAVACCMHLMDAPGKRREQLDLLQCRIVIDGGVDLGGAGAEDNATDTPAAYGPFCMLGTSGSSGEPKVAVHSFSTLMAAARASNDHNGLGAEDRWMLSLPCYHVAGLGIIFRCMAAGAAIVIPDKEDSMGDCVLKCGVTHLSLVAAQLAKLLAHPEIGHIAAKLKSVLVGGGAAPDEMISEAIGVGVPVCKTYGLTEMGSQVASVPACASGSKRFTSGQALPGVGLRLRANGEVFVRGPSLFVGYWVDGQIRDPRDPNGWFATGDLGALDIEGYLSISGRKDSMFVSGGENIQPEEIERTLRDHADIRDAVVVPVHDEKFGLRPFAFVRQGEGVEISLERLNQWLAGRLGRHKQLKGVAALDSNLAGKLKPSRPELRKVAEIIVAGPNQAPAGQA